MDIIKNIKLILLQNRYKYLSDIILNLQKHIENLYLINYFEYSLKNHYLNNLFIISKKLNSSYNSFILNKLLIKDKLYEIINKIYSILVDKNEEDIITILLPLIINKKNTIPLYEHENNLLEIIIEIGYNNLKDLINIYYNIKLTDTQLEFINEINNIFIPIKINHFFVSNYVDEYFWRIPMEADNNDLLNLNKELWIKDIDSRQSVHLKIDGFFINDSLSTFIKTSQINHSILQKQKSNIMTELKNSSIDQKFIKNFMRYDYLGNIYCLSSKDYLKYIENAYSRFLEISSFNFITIMKDFISVSNRINKIYEYIFLLLLGNNDNIDIAGLLLGLIKEKNKKDESLEKQSFSKGNLSIPSKGIDNETKIYNLICSRLPYYLLVKIKKSTNNMNLELNKLKSLSTEDIDLKKQLIIKNNIPNSVKSLTLEKIEEMKSFNNDYYKQLTFVKHILNFPWSSPDDELFFKNIKSSPKKSKEYLLNVEDKLKKLTYGHEEAKKILLQTIGKWISNPTSQGTCFGLVGPPGVGKTLLAKSVSKALDIPFAEITLGGQNDGEILHGHGYTYSGSQPGLIVKKMVEMGKSRCILYFDELDKTCSKHGSINEITSILIHLTDPNMNKTFQDRFFQGIDFPLDKVIMIFSYNDSKLVDPILLDRLKQIEVSAYTTNEKIKIVKEFIINELATTIGLTNENWINISDDLIEYMIENYTNEAGVRTIKRKIEQIFLTLNIDKILNKKNMKKMKITKEIINDILQKPNKENTLINKEPEVGIVNGLYATSNGEGGIIPIQVFTNHTPNKNHFDIKLTGKQGDVMKESVYCSLTTAIEYIKKHNKSELDNYHNGFHIHTPSTATPKDGPSAGCAFTTAFISRILNKKVRNDIGMTGEIELTGKITKIGGLNFKLIGAKKAGIKIVFVPKENEDDLDEIKNKYPNLIDDNFQVKLFDNISEIIDEILV